ncbi:MAG: hypothetical protein AAF539_12900, partial [Planctomycetota bacterium]
MPDSDASSGGDRRESSIEVTPDALERQRRSELSLRNRLASLPHDPVPTDLPPIVGESQVVLESPGDVARR